MDFTVISTPDAPAAIGPYSQAVRAGQTVYTSGQISIDPKTAQLVPGGIAEQTAQVLNNLKAVLAASGLTLSNIVKTTVFIQNMDDFTLFNEVYASFFEAPYPARSTVEVSRLPKGALVEIEAVAVG